MRWNGAHEVLDYAIAREQEAHDFYAELAERAGTMKEIFAGFAREEAGHKQALEKIKAGRRWDPPGKKILDLKIADYVVDVAADPGMSYRDALVVAMKREKASFRLYSDLAETAEDEGVKEAFLRLAQEEAKHKLRFEVEYDSAILVEN
jgi:rubrerythrin